MRIDWNDYYLIQDNDELAVTMRDMKAHLNISDYDGDDALIRSYIMAACSFFEGPTGFGYVLMSKTYGLDIENLPSALHIKLAPIQTVEIDQGGTVYTPTGNIRTGKITPRAGGPATLTIRAGYDDSDKVPADIKQMIKMMVADWYRSRENTHEYNYQSVPVSFTSILDNYRRF